jgi:hippurate hydrolase
MIKDGLFERFPMDAIFGVHNWPGIPVGHFAIKSGAMSASCNDFRIVIRGKGTHAAMPHNGIDPVFIACHLVQALQSIITRNKRPFETGVISVTIIHAGEATNVIPDSCELCGTVRTFSLETLDLIERRMRQVVTGTCQTFEATCDFEFRRVCPPTVNHPKETEFARSVLTTLVGEEKVQDFEPTMGAEDFSFFMLEKPGCYFVIGNGEGEHRVGGHGEGPCMLHNPSYDFNDKIISLGASMWVRLVESWFAVATPNVDSAI